MKPLDGNHGRGVMLNLADDAAVRAAYPLAREESRYGGVVVESFLVGNDYRCLVVVGCSTPSPSGSRPTSTATARRP